MENIILCDKDAINYALTMGSNLNQKYKDVYLLTYAAVWCDEDILKLLLSFNVTQEEKDTSLLLAAKFGRFDSVLNLIKAGANINTVDIVGINILGSAAEGVKDKSTLVNSEYGKMIIYLIISLNFDVERKDSLDRTPLMIAAGSGHIAAIEILVKLGADVNARNNQGRRALEYAESLGQIRAAKILASMSEQ